jgi:hypothetical protein
MYENLPTDIQNLLNNLIDDQTLLNDAILPISKKSTNCCKLLLLEHAILENPTLDSETLYIHMLEHWAYASCESNDINNGKKGKLVGEFEYTSNNNILIYQIENGKNSKYFIMYEKTIIGYINLSIENNLIIHTACDNFFNSEKGSIKLFLKKWFIPKYNLNITEKDLDKLLKEIK